jgi:membrane-associated protease RseP (regulator of RpoE activity)
MPYKEARIPALQIILFVLTCITTTLAGVEWIFGRPLFYSFLNAETFPFFTWAQLRQGLLFSIPFLAVLTCHEFGHYLTARYYRIRVSLPYYIPVWFGPVSTIGTMGAFIRIRERIISKKEFFDVGIAGPLAGFVVALPLLFYGFTHLPDATYIFRIHPEYEQYGLNYAEKVYQQTNGASFALGKNLLFLFFERYVASDPAALPNAYEVIHYPLLFAGYLSLFFTALNLLPIGQLDGGHILYGLIGQRHFNRLSPILFVVFISYAGLGIFSPHVALEEAQWIFPAYGIYLYVVLRGAVPSSRHAIGVIAGILVFQYGMAYLFPDLQGYMGWLVFGLLLGRFLGVYHPAALDERPLSAGRKVLGYLALLIFVLCFSPTPFVVK